MPLIDLTDEECGCVHRRLSALFSEHRFIAETVRKFLAGEPLDPFEKFFMPNCVLHLTGLDLRGYNSAEDPAGVRDKVVEWLANYDKAQILVNKFKPAEPPPCSPAAPS